MEEDEDDNDGDRGNVLGTKLVPVTQPYIHITSTRPVWIGIKAPASIYGPSKHAGGGFNYHYHLNINNHNAPVFALLCTVSSLVVYIQTGRGES